MAYTMISSQKHKFKVVNLKIKARIHFMVKRLNKSMRIASLNTWKPRIVMIANNPIFMIMRDVQNTMR